MRCRRRPQRGSRLCWSHDPSAEAARAEAERRKAEWRAQRGAELSHEGTHTLLLKARLELARKRVRVRALIEDALAGLDVHERTEVLLDLLVVTALAEGGHRE